MARKLVSAAYRGEIARPTNARSTTEGWPDRPHRRCAGEKRNPLGLTLLPSGSGGVELDDGSGDPRKGGPGSELPYAGYVTPTKPGSTRHAPESGYIHPERDPVWQSYGQLVRLTLWDLQGGDRAK